MIKRLVLCLCLAAPLGCTPAAPESSGPGAQGGGTGADANEGTGGTGGSHGHLHDAALAGGGAGGNGPALDAAHDPEPAAEDGRDESDMARSVSDPASLAIAGQLQGAFLQVDCASAEIELQYCHPKDKGIQNLTFKFGGEPGKTYSVVLRVWGVVEGVRYVGGKAGGEHFYIGGMGNTPGTAEYGLIVGPRTYYLNYFEQDAGEHYTYGVSYETDAITIPGGAVLGLFVHDPDDFMNTNHMDSKPDHPSPGLQAHLAQIHSQPLQGQFVYLEVASATLAAP